MILTRYTHASDGTLLQRESIARNPAQGDAVWYRRWTYPGSVLVEDRAATTKEETKFLAAEEMEAEGEQQTEDHRADAFTALLAIPTYGNTIATMFVALGLVPVKIAKSLGWTPPP